MGGVIPPAPWTPFVPSGEIGASGTVLTSKGPGNAPKWESGGGGGSLSVTDGTHTVADVTEITFSGATVSGSSPDATVTISGGGGVPAATVPAQMPGLLYWFDSSILSPELPTGAGNGIPLLGSPDPYRAPGSAIATGGGAVVSATDLNALPVLQFAGTAAGEYELEPLQIVTPAVTIFAVLNPASLASTMNFLGGATNSIALGVLTTGALNLQVTNVAGVPAGGSTAKLAIDTWVQVNVSYNSASGAYSYRIARTADISGSDPQTVNAAQSGFGSNGSSPQLDWNGSIAEVIYYDRVLTLAQIEAVEAYLLAKWGV
jgi:hypothetical protein